jgi:hypothetical protein
MPITLQVNRVALKNLKDKWELPDAVLARANVVEDETGRHTQTPQLGAAASPSSTTPGH